MHGMRSTSHAWYAFDIACIYLFLAYVQLYALTHVCIYAYAYKSIWLCYVMFMLLLMLMHMYMYKCVFMI